MKKKSILALIFLAILMVLIGCTNVESVEKEISIVINDYEKNEIFNEVDLACFMETVGDQRTISFTPTDRYSAKGNHGVEGRYNVDDLTKVGKNVFLTKLLEIYHSNIMKEEEINAKYNAVMEKYTTLIEKCDNADGINDLLVAIPNQEHYFSSKEELGARLNNKAKELGLVYNKATKKYESVKDNTNTN